MMPRLAASSGRGGIVHHGIVVVEPIDVAGGIWVIYPEVRGAVPVLDRGAVLGGGSFVRWSRAVEVFLPAAHR